MCFQDYFSRIIGLSLQKFQSVPYSAKYCWPYPSSKHSRKINNFRIHLSWMRLFPLHSHLIFKSDNDVFQLFSKEVRCPECIYPLGCLLMFILNNTRLMNLKLDLICVIKICKPHKIRSHSVQSLITALIYIHLRPRSSL